MRFYDSITTPAVAPVTIHWNDIELSALPGESVAAALAAHNITTLRKTRNNAPRGLYCGMGACFDCLVTIDGRSGERACLATVHAGMRVTSIAGGAALAAAPLTPAPTEAIVDVLIVGAGPGGLGAAEAAAERGAAVVVLDERALAGGQFYKPLAPSHRFVNDVVIDQQFYHGAALVESARAAGARIEQNATVWSTTRSDAGALEIAALVAGRAMLFRPKRLVLAPGAYERPVPIPGWTLPGVMTTGALQTLARSYRVSPGASVVIAGNGPLNLQLAVELTRAGVRVKAVVETAPKPGLATWRHALAMYMNDSELTRDGLRYLAALRRARVPIYWASTAVSADGTDQFTSVRIQSPRGEQWITADILALGHGFVPATELARQLDCTLHFVDHHIGYAAVTADDTGRTSHPDVYAIGDGAALGGARIAYARGVLAGVACAESLGLGAARLQQTDPAWVNLRAEIGRAERFQRALWSLFSAPPVNVSAIDDATIICRCEEVAAGQVRVVLTQPTATIGAVKRHTRCGMGRCQGRYCQATVARMVAAQTGEPVDVNAFFAPRPPAKPIALAAIAFEKSEWGGHLEVQPPPPTTRGTQRAMPSFTPALSADVVVIGGGVAGLSAAYYLAREGVDTLLLERDEPNLQASGANAGSLHVQLLSFDFGPKAQAGGGPAADTLRLGPISVKLWQDIEQASGRDLEIHTPGGLMVADTVEQAAFLRAKIALEARHGIVAHWLDTAALRELAPGLDERIVGAEFCPAEGKINPLTATYALADLARRHGARIESRTDVRAIVRAGSRWRIDTSRGVVHAGRIVNAAGPWTPLIAKMVGIDKLPVQGAPLQMMVTEAAPATIKHLIAHADRHLSLKQAASGAFVIGGGWSASVNPANGFAHTLRSSIEGNAWVAQRVLPMLNRTRLIRAWAAINVNIDGAPIVGEAPGVPGFFNCVTSNGYTLGPVVGRITAELIRHGQSSIAIAPYELNRFNTSPHLRSPI